MSTGSNAEQLQASREAARATKGYQRVAALFDEGTFHEIDAFAKSGGQPAGAVAGYGEIGGCPVYAFAQNSDVDGGAMTKAQASKIKKVYDFAVKTGAPVVGIYDSIGGCLGEGADMLAAYGEILRNGNNLSGVVPQIAIVLGPCIATTAMIAAGADVLIMSEKAELTVDAGGKNGSAEEAQKLGLCQIAAKDEAEAIAQARRLISILPSNNLCGAPVMETQAAGGAVSAGQSAWEAALAVADEGSMIDFAPAFGKTAAVGLCQMGGYTVGAVAYSAVIDAEACAKTARFVRFCDAFSIPVVTFVDAQEFSSLREASKLSNAYSEATTAKVTVITGDAYGPVYIAVAGRGANADYTMAWDSAVVSALAPQTAALFLWNDRLAGSANPVEDRNKLIEEYKTTQATPFAAAADGLIEDIVAPGETRERIVASLAMLEGKRVSRLPKKHANIQI